MFFLPIGDTPNPTRTGWMTWLLIAINLAIHLAFVLPASFLPADPTDPATLALADRLHLLAADAAANLTRADLLIEQWGFKPGAPSIVDLFASMFLHAGLAHLGGNLLFLWIYGDNVEARVGRMGYLALYLGTGVLATLTFAALAADPTTPLVGASGAISGVLGAYFVMFPRNRVKMLVVLLPFLVDVWLVPAPLVLGAYVLIDNLLPLVIGASSGVAFGAHLGGFVGGAAVGWLIDRAWAPRATPDPAAAWVERGDALAAEGQVGAAFQAYLRALEATDDPETAARARSGLRRLPLDPRLAARLGLDPT